VIYTFFAIVIAVSGTIDLFRGEFKLALIEYLIVAILIPAVIVLRNRDRRERLMPVEEPPPRWY
jgi:hypothetical protein